MIALAAALCIAASAQAQDWARDMFNHTSHDFGTVARGAKVEHRFPLENIYLEDAHIQSARVSCGCTTPEVPTQVIKTWQKAEVVAKVDTKAYLGQKDVTITVVFDRPFYAEIQLQIHCYIRSDVVIQPGVVQFGSVTQGAGSQQKVVVSYAGRSDWQIQKIESPNPNVSARATEVSRGNGLVTYDLSVDLAPGAPAGYIREQLNLVTNDTNPRAVRVPVPIEGVVRSAVTVHPALLYMGTVEPGKSITQQLMVHGDLPFRILRLSSSNPQFHCVPPGTAGTLQRVTVVFHAGNSPGKATGKIQIETDAGTVPLESVVSVDVVSPTVEPAVAPAAPKSSDRSGPPLVSKPSAGREL